MRTIPIISSYILFSWIFHTEDTPEKETQERVYDVRVLKALKIQDILQQKNTKNFAKKSCIIYAYTIY